MLFTKEITKRLLENGERQEAVRGTKGEIDFEPVVKLFTPDGGATWLLSEIMDWDHDIAFGLCDLGMQCPELGLVRISELMSARGVLGLPIERDLSFKADKSLLEYSRQAHEVGRIVA